MAPAPIVITGASTGLGKAAALQLADKGHPIVMVAREGQKARDAQAEIIRETGNRAVTLEAADLSSQAEIHGLAERITALHPTIAVLINNAGAQFRQRRLSVDGIEMTLAVNHLAPFLLTNLLLGPLRAHGDARVVVTASDLQVPIDLNDLNRDKRYDGFKVYGQSKLANVQFTFELAKRLAGTGVTVNCVAPGFVRTQLFRNTGGLSRLFLGVVGPVLMTSPRKAAKKLVRLAADPALYGVNGQYFAKDKPARAIEAAYDLASAQLLWWQSEQLTGMKYADLQALA